MNRIKQLRTTLHYTQASLAKLLGVARSTVAMWETSTQNPDYDTLIKISQLFNVPPDFVMGAGIFAQWDDIIHYYDDVSFNLIEMIPGDLMMPTFSEDKYLVAWLDTRLYYEPDELQLARWFAFAVQDISVFPPKEDENTATVRAVFTPEFQSLIETHNSHKSNTTRIPVLGNVAAGIPIEAVQDIVDYEEIDAAMASSGEYFGLRIKGSSMEPRMREGDVVIVRKQDYADTGDTVVALVNGESATVKKIKKGPDGISLIPTNPAYDPMYYTAEEVESLPVRILGRVVELRAKY